MVKYYVKWKKGMKKSKNGKYYYPKKSGKKVSTKQLVAARQPIIETKKNEAGQSTFNLSITTAGQFVALRSFLDMSRGTDGTDMIGDSVFSKYIKMKLKFRFPRDEYAIRDNYRIQLIHGWMTAPFSLAETPVGNPYAPAMKTVSPAELEGIVAARLGDDFNAVGDDMAFREKRKKIYKVLGKQWIKPDRNNQIGFAQQFGRYAAETDHIIGGIPDVVKSLTWTPMRRTKYQYSTPPNDSPFYYPNESWIPFVCIYCPDYPNIPAPGEGQQQSDFQVKCIVNDCHWFSDS